ncbi:MFS general substrate transporter [Acephala macrosclerotiorum]|nr:MFS general substrate transporter [Acephala macrosclerotiorum]
MSISHDENEDAEQERLLSNENGDDNSLEEAQGASLKSTPPLTRVILYFMAIHFLLAFCEMILVAPLIKLFENSLCLKYYDFPVSGIEEALCKVPKIQGPLATIRGWKSSFDMIAVLLVAIPFGRLGDRHGRKKIMGLAVLGVVFSLVEIFVICAFPQTFPVRLVWFSSLLLLCGGGLNAASAYMWALAAESIPSDRRSHAFYYIFSAFYVAELIGSFVASVTIEISPWIPCGLALVSLLACFTLLAIMPSTGRSTLDSGVGESPKSSGVREILSTLSNRNVLLVVPVFLVGIFRYTTLNILIQYASVRFGLRISTGATFYTETAVVNIFLFLFLIPQLSARIRKERHVRPQVIDLFLVRMSVTLMCVGCLAIGLAQTGLLLPVGVFIFASGFGSRVSALSLVAYWIPDDTKATFFAAIVVFESLGHAIFDPAMQQIFATSLKLAEFWWALPFFVGAGLYFCAVVSSTFIHIDEKEINVQDRDEISDHED